MIKQAFGLTPEQVKAQVMANLASGHLIRPTSQQRSGAAAGGGFAGIPTWAWLIGGAAAAGGVWYFFIRQPAAA